MYKKFIRVNCANCPLSALFPRKLLHGIQISPRPAKSLGFRSRELTNQLIASLVRVRSAVRIRGGPPLLSPSAGRYR